MGRQSEFEVSSKKRQKYSQIYKIKINNINTKRQEYQPVTSKLFNTNVSLHQKCSPLFNYYLFFYIHFTRQPPTQPPNVLYPLWATPAQSHPLPHLNQRA